MKVLFVLPSLLRGGAEVQTVDLVNGLNPIQFEKFLVTFEKPLDQKERIDAKSVRFLHFTRRSKFDRSPARAIAHIIDSQHIDIVYCSLQMALLMGSLAVRYSSHKPKFIVALHTTINRSLKYEIFDRLLYQWLMRNCNKVICVCHAQEQHWQRKFPFLIGKTRVIHNGVDTEKFSREISLQAGRTLRQQLGISEQAKVICHIAGFRQEKGHFILLDSFRILVRRVSNAFLLFVGDGILRPEIEKRVHDAALESQVRFLGLQSDVRPVLSSSDCSVLASTAVETFSIAMLESMAMGVPLVATNVGGTSEAVLDGKTGLLVEPGNADQLAEALAAMLSDDARRIAMGCAGRALVESKFSAAVMNAQTECMLREASSQ
jgi:glycosyltransferase involved in cell wall biosynthesis